MCTSVSCCEAGLFGRNLDLDRPFGQRVLLTPRHHVLRLCRLPALSEHFAMLGMAAVAGDMPLYAEAVNEKGLYMAGLYFPAHAAYSPDGMPGRVNAAAHELIPLVLGTCATLAQAKELLGRVCVTADTPAPAYPAAPLHWHIADASGSLVAEPMADGLHVYDAPVGVLTNEPPFPWHMTNLCNYQHLSPRPPENRFAPGLALRAYGQGMGAVGLPGDASPASRFVRAAFFKTHARFEGDGEERAARFFAVLDAVAMIRGCVVTPEGTLDSTLYACCIDARAGLYRWKTERSTRVFTASLRCEEAEGDALVTFPGADEA